MNIVYPSHIGFIPDGNRRFAKREGCALRTAYLRGAEAAAAAVGCCIDRGIKEISFYGASAQNLLKRPKAEIADIQVGIAHFYGELVRRGARVDLIGNPSHAVVPEYAELFNDRPRASGTCCVHIDAGASGGIREELQPLLTSIQRLGFRTVSATPQAFVRTGTVPPIDLLIRTGMRRRLSNFLPWQCGNAELCFLDLLWPEFAVSDLEAALSWYQAQDRTVGA